MAMTIIGRILSIGQTMNTPSKDGTKTYSNRRLVLDCTTTSSTGQTFENTPEFEFDGNLCTELDKYMQGQIVQISFDLRGIKYTSRTTGQQGIYTKVRPYKIEPYTVGYLQQPQVPQQAMRQPAPQQPNITPQQPAYPQNGYPQQPQQPAFNPGNAADQLPF
jgi:hypothetical protein